MLEWLDGDTMNAWAKERYRKITASRYRTKAGVMFGSAGMWLIIGTSTAFISRGGAQAVIWFTVFFALAVLCIAAAFYVRGKCKKAVESIDNNGFRWKSDTVRKLLPDRYPKPNKILISSEEEPCYLLQAYFFFKEGEYVYAIKPDNPEAGKELLAFIG